LGTGASVRTFPLSLSSHSRTCRAAHTRPAPVVLGDAGTRLQSGMLRVISSRPDP
jgi:hypothetical protein